MMTIHTVGFAIMVVLAPAAPATGPAERTGSCYRCPRGAHVRTACRGREEVCYRGSLTSIPLLWLVRNLARANRPALAPGCRHAFARSLNCRQRLTGYPYYVERWLRVLTKRDG